MTFPKGQWTTEYAVKISLTDGTESVYFASPNPETPSHACEQFRLKGADAEIVTRQVFHGEWQPLPERTDT